MQVLIFTLQVPPPFGGMQTWFLDLVRAAGCRHPVDVVCPDSSAFGPRPGVRRVGKVDRSLLRTKDGRRILLEQFEKLVAEWKPDVIHFCQAGLSFLAPRMSSLGIPCVLSVHGNDVIRTWHWHDPREARQAILREGLGSVVAVTAVSRYTRDLVRAAGAADPIYVIPPAIDTGKFSPGDRLEARRRLGIPDDRQVILSVGRLVGRKGVAAVLDALPMIRDRTPYYVIVGTGPEEEANVRRVSGHVLFESIFLAGSVPDSELPDYYRAADIFVLPVDSFFESESDDVEGFGIVFLEAAAAGLPVVSCIAGGVPEAVSDGVSGILVPSRDEGRLAAALATLLDDPDKAREFGCAGRERAIHEFSFERFSRRFYAIYREVMGGGASGPFECVEGQRSR